MKSLVVDLTHSASHHDESGIANKVSVLNELKAL